MVIKFAEKLKDLFAFLSGRKDTPKSLLVRKAIRRLMIAVGLFAAVLLLWSAVFANDNVYFSSLYDHPVPDGILDGNPRTFVVVGYSTSLSPDSENSWPAVLQRMLDAHTRGQRIYHIYNKAIGGTPLAELTDICSQDTHMIDDIITELVNPATHKDMSRDGNVPKATVILAQESLQFVFDCNDRYVEIEVAERELPGAEDMARIEKGAAAFAYFANLFTNGGIERVYIATHIYAGSDRYEYKLYGERLALAHALDQELAPGLYPGPELWGVTKTLFDVEGGFKRDLRHPEYKATHAMALYWYIVLAGSEADRSVMEPIAEIAGIPIPEIAQMKPLSQFYNKFRYIPLTITFQANSNRPEATHPGRKKLRAWKTRSDH